MPMPFLELHHPANHLLTHTFRRAPRPAALVAHPSHALFHKPRTPFVANPRADPKLPAQLTKVVRLKRSERKFSSLVHDFSGLPRHALIFSRCCTQCYPCP